MKFLIIRLSSFGDVILSTPVLEEIKRVYPESQIDFIVMDRFKDAISGNPYMDNLIIFEKERYKGIFGIMKFCKNRGEYDYIIDIHAKIRSKLMGFFIKGKVLRYKKRVWWKTLLVKLGIIKYRVDDTIVKNYFRPLKKLGINYSGENLLFSYEKRDLEAVQQYSGAVVFAPGASKETKKWPVENFAKLAELLENEKLVIVGGKNEYNEFDIIAKQTGERCINLCGKLTLKESGALLSTAKYIVTNDSGPFHIARGVKTKSYVIFGPTDPGMFSYGEKEKLIYANEPCSPCSLHGDLKCPKEHFNCMKKITPESVYKIIKE